MTLITPVIIFGAKIQTLLADNAAFVAASGISIAHDLSDHTLHSSILSGVPIKKSFFEEHHDLKTQEKITRLTNDLIATSFYEPRRLLFPRSQVALRLGLPEDELAKRDGVGRKLQELFACEFSLDDRLISLLTGGQNAHELSVGTQLEMMGEFMKSVSWIAESPSYSHLREILTRMGSSVEAMKVLLSNPPLSLYIREAPVGMRAFDLSVKELGKLIGQIRDGSVIKESPESSPEDFPSAGKDDVGHAQQNEPVSNDTTKESNMAQPLTHEKAFEEFKEIRRRVRDLALQIFTLIRKLTKLQKQVCASNPKRNWRLLRERRKMHEVVLQVLNLQMMGLRESTEKFGPYKAKSEKQTRMLLREFNIREDA